MRKTTILIISLITVAIIGVMVYWFMFMNKDTTTLNKKTPTNTNFSPFNSKSTINNTETTPASTTETTNNTSESTDATTLPKLRQLSTTPVGGMSASSTAVRFIDRGVGHVFEAGNESLIVDKISNTTIPKIYQSYWNKNLTSLIIRYIKDDSDNITNFYAELRKVASSSIENSTDYEIKGKFLSANIKEVAVSPSKDRVFTWNIEGGRGIGYISSFDEKGKVKIIDSPLTQVNIDWPEKDTISFATKPSANSTGYSYTADTKTGIIKKVLGGIRGLSTKINTDKTKMLYSYGGINSINLSLVDTKNQTTESTLFKTLADKCVWSSLRKKEAYCAVPVELPNGVYPDDWYKGTISLVDQIWHIDTETGEVHLLANLLSLSNKLIDVTNITLDPSENFLYFINKRDLTLWSLDLNQ